MTSHFFLRVALCALLLVGCSSSSPPPKRLTEDMGPKRQLDLARAFETGSDLRRAIFMYELIARNYPRSPVTTEATRKAAVLTGSVRNPERSDSVSLQWFRKYLGLPITPAERENAELCISLLDRVLTQQRHGMYHAAIADSLQLVVRQQREALALQSQRLLELERNTRNANAEVKKLKDIDVRLSQSRRRR